MKKLFKLSQFDKYYFKQIITYFFGSTAIFVLLFVLGQVRIILETISLENLSFFYILRLLILTIPMHLFISMPVGLNLANALLFGFMAVNSEILAIRSFGAKVEVFLKPVLIFALIVCFLVYLDMDFLYPYANKIYLELLVKGQMKTIQSMLQEGKVMTYKNYKIYIGSSSGSSNDKTYYDVVITQSSSNSYNSVYAKKAKIEDNPSSLGLISLTLIDGDYIINFQDKRNLIAKFDRLYLIFSKPDTITVGESYLMYTIKRLNNTIKDFRSKDADRSSYRFIEEKLHFKIGLLISCILFAFAGFAIVKAFARLNLGISLFTSICTIMIFYFIFIGLSKTLVARTLIPIPIIYYPLLGVIALISLILYFIGFIKN
ncbi:MAG TPA: LptF/LptG family permease [Exilispira sp.]|nr:LptF/LptG family permease [Exilispira sp.]